MVEPRRMALQAANDLPQARSPRKLAVKQGDELTFGGQPTYPLVGAMLGHKAIKRRPGNMLQKIVQNAILVPQRAVMELQGIYQVAVVGSDNKASIRTVKVGETQDGLWIIEEGLTADDRVVVEGIQNVKDGALVNIK